jgi:hypothetical protein
VAWWSCPQTDTRQTVARRSHAPRFRPYSILTFALFRKGGGKPPHSKVGWHIVDPGHAINRDAYTIVVILSAAKNLIQFSSAPLITSTAGPV